MAESERTHFIRVHRPFSVPKQWVCGPIVAPADLDFTEDQNLCGHYTLAEAVALIDDMNTHFPGLIIALDAI